MKIYHFWLILLLLSLCYCDIKIYEDQTTRLFNTTIKITDHTGDHHHPAWSPDGSMIVYSSSPWVTKFIRRVLLEDDSVPFFYFQDRVSGKPALSPDRANIAFCSASRGQIWIYSIDDDSERILTPGQKNACQPAWSADGQFIAYLSRPEIHLDSLQPYVNQVFVISASGGNSIQLATGDSLQFNNLCWSPDNSQIVASARSESTLKKRIYIISNENGNVRYVDTGSDFNDYPVWAPDGREIAFVYQDDDQQHISIMPINGKEPQKITQHSFGKIYNLDWLAGSSSIVFQAIRSILFHKKQTWIVSSDQKYEYMVLTDKALSFPQWLSATEILYCKTGNFLAQLKVLKLVFEIYLESSFGGSINCNDLPVEDLAFGAWNLPASWRAFCNYCE